MADEIVTQKPRFSVALQAELESNKSALPQGFNISRFVQNSLALLNGNEALQKFNKQYGPDQIRIGLVRAAYLGLDALHNECYLVPYGSVINFVTSYTGAIKMAKKYSTEPIKTIYAEVVKEGDQLNCWIEDGKKRFTFKKDPFSSNKVIGVIAVCVFSDDHIDYELMSYNDLETVRKQSKARNAMAWGTFTDEMYKKAAIRRLCKRITLDMDAKETEAFDSGLEMETDQRELRNRDISEYANSEDFIEVESEVVSS